MNWTEIITIFLGTGIISTFAQLFLANNLNKRFFRFSNLYKDKLDIIREFYKLLIKAEKALNILMSSREPELKKGQDGNATEESKMEIEVFRKNTINVVNIFLNFYEENEIVFEDEIVIYIKQLKEKFEKSLSAHSLATHMESCRPSKAWENAVQAKQDAYDGIVSKDIPDLKKEMKRIFQNRYKLLETN